MTEDQSPIAHSTSLDMSAAAAAILEFASDTGTEKQRGELTYITSKDAFVWAGIAALIAQSVSPSQLPDDINIHAQIYRIAASRTYETTLPRIGWFHPLDSQEFRGWSVKGQSETGNNFFYALITSLFESYCQPINPDVIQNKVNQNIQTGYKELLNKELITDPVIELALGLCILNFMPFSIVKRTKNGNEVYRKLQALAWKYERIKRSGNTTETNLTFEAARIARALKVGLIAAWEALTKGPGDEP